MTDSHHQIVAHLIKRLRTEAGLKQTDLSQRLGVTQSIVSKFESGERRLDLIEVWQICQICGVSLEDFVRRVAEALREGTDARQ